MAFCAACMHSGLNVLPRPGVAGIARYTSASAPQYVTSSDLSIRSIV